MRIARLLRQRGSAVVAMVMTVLEKGQAVVTDDQEQH